MSDYRETVAARLERAADRMLNAGFMDEERSYREAAARVRGGHSLEETRAIEQRMLTGQMPRLSNRLTALAAQGEYDAGGGGSEAEGSTASAAGEAAQEPVLTETESGASQLLSTAPSTGLSNPFSTAQSGWNSGTEPPNPYSGIAGAGGDDWSAYNTNGQSLQSYSGIAPVGDNPNSYTTGQNINALTGDQNTDAFSPSPSNYYSDQNTSLLNNPNLLALNDAAPVNADTASDAVPSYTSNDSADQSYRVVYINGVPYYSFGAYDNTGAQIYDPGLTIEDRSSIIVFPDDPLSASQPQSTQAPTTTQPAAPPIDAPLTPAQEAQLNAAIQQAVASSPPIPVDAGQPTNINDVLAGTDLALPASTPAQPPDQPTQPVQPAPPVPATPPAAAPQPGSGVVPFNPMADSPFASWLLYGNDTPVLDFLTNDANLQVAQNVAAGVAVTAGTIATGGMLLEAAPGIVAASNAAIASATASANAAAAGLTPTLLTAGAGGILATNPGLTEELAEEVETLGPELENTLQSTVTGPSFEGVIDPSEFENDPEIIDRLSRAREFDVGGYQSLTGRGEFGRPWDYLDADEALQNAFIRVAKDVERVSEVTRDNPAIALRPEIHQLIANLTTQQMQGLSAEDVLQFHLQQLVGIVPDYVLVILEREALQYVSRTF